MTATRRSLALMLAVFVLPPLAAGGVSVGAAAAAAAAVFDVTAFGAKGDGVTRDTAAIRNACAALARAGGGTLLFPSDKRFLTGAFNLS
eukprot:SAG31_NODE_22860_length_516_cov_1.203837_1_plen_88_part_10